MKILCCYKTKYVYCRRSGEGSPQKVMDWREENKLVDCVRLRANKHNNSQQCWELLANNVAPFAWGLKYDRFQTLCNNKQQLPTICNRVCKWTQHVTSNNVASVCMQPNLQGAGFIMGSKMDIFRL